MYVCPCHSLTLSQLTLPPPHIWLTVNSLFKPSLLWLYVASLIIVHQILFLRIMSKSDGDFFHLLPQSVQTVTFQELSEMNWLLPDLIRTGFRYTILYWDSWYIMLSSEKLLFPPMPVVSNMKVVGETQAGLNSDTLKIFFPSNTIIFNKEPSHL